jgi:hypothetical protein
MEYNIYVYVDRMNTELPLIFKTEQDVNVHVLRSDEEDCTKTHAELYTMHAGDKIEIHNGNVTITDGYSNMLMNIA